MGKELKLVARDFISVNHYMGYRAVMKGRKPLVMPFTKPEARKFKKEFSEYAKEQVKLQGWDIEKTRTRHHFMDCIFYFPRIDMDEQNYMKCTADALNGVAYIDDRNILTRTHRIYYDNTGEARIEITIKPVPYIGIFDNEQQLHNFEENCKTCTRYKRNCSILNKAKEGRIQEGLDEKSLVCSKYKEVKK